MVTYHEMDLVSQADMQSLEIIVMCFDSLERRNRWAFMKTFNGFDVRRFLIWFQGSPIFLKV